MLELFNDTKIKIIDMAVDATDRIIAIQEHIIASQSLKTNATHNIIITLINEYVTRIKVIVNDGLETVDSMEKRFTDKLNTYKYYSEMTCGRYGRIASPERFVMMIDNLYDDIMFMTHQQEFECRELLDIIRDELRDINDNLDKCIQILGKMSPKSFIYNNTKLKDISPDNSDDDIDNEEDDETMDEFISGLVEYIESNLPRETSNKHDKSINKEKLNDAIKKFDKLFGDDEI